MKAVLNHIIVALTVAAGWYFHPGIVTSMEASLENARKKRAHEIATAVKEVTGGTASAGGTETTSSAALTARQLADSLRKSNSGAPSRTDLPGGTPQPSPTAATEAPVIAQVDEFEAKYPLPVFKEISEITKEWSSIPSRAFPRPVKTLVPINLESPTGKIQLAAQSDALAVAMTQGMLVVIKDRENPARSLVPIANTDLKETLTNLYEKYKTYKIDQIMKQRERARGLKARANGATAAELAAAGPKPKVESGGVITAMAVSLRRKDIKETTEERVTAWGDLNIEEINGGSYWTGTIQCTVDNAIFGPTPTELMALIRDEKVVKWLYSGSKEEVQ